MFRVCKTQDTVRKWENLQVLFQDCIFLQLIRWCIIHNVLWKTEGTGEDTVSLERILLPFQDSPNQEFQGAQSSRWSWLLVVVERNSCWTRTSWKSLLAGDLTSSISCRLMFPSSSCPDALPDWKLTEPEIDLYLLPGDSITLWLGNLVLVMSPKRTGSQVYCWKSSNFRKDKNSKGEISLSVSNP